MAPINNTSVIFNEVPHGFPVVDKSIITKTESIDLDAVELNGGTLTKALYFSIDPYLRNLMREPDSKTNLPEYHLGKPIWGFAVASVIRSEKDGIKAGDILYVPNHPFQQYSVLPADHPIRVIPHKENVPLTTYIGVLGMPGMTAFYGLELIGKPKKGETIYVSSGASAVGSLVVQLAKSKGLKVIASAGSEDKVQFMKSIGADVAFNYKKDSVKDVLAKHGPIDVFWDNVGGSTLEAALEACNEGGRVVICGAISGYNSTGEPYGIKTTTSILYKRLRVEGLFVNLSEEEYEGQLNNPVKFLDALVPLIQSGELKWTEQVFDGVEKVGEAMVAVQTGASTAKVIVKVADP